MLCRFCSFSFWCFKLQAYSGAPPTDEKEKVIWVRFDKADINGKSALLCNLSFDLSLCVEQTALLYVVIFLSLFEYNQIVLGWALQ